MTNRNNRVDVSFDKSNRKTVTLEDFDRFKPVLYSNLSVPSYVHGYSLGIEYMKNWFLKGFPKNFFKYVHVNGKHMFDDFKRFNEQNVKREKPLLIITPNADYDWDRENLDLYLGGKDIYLKRSDFQNSFLQDKDKKLYLGMQMQQIKMEFNFRVRVATRAQQLDVFKLMELTYRIGSTQSEYTSADFHIPKDIILNIAKHAGFEILNNEVKEPTLFLRYLNAHSQIPFMYKLRAISNTMEFFLRLDGLYTHITCSDKLSLDDGERVGQLDNNFNIDMQCIFTMPVPQFFIYFDQQPLDFDIQVDRSGIGIYSLGQFVIPEKNENGWDSFIHTDCLTDPGEKEIEMSCIFEGTDLDKIIKDSLSKFISPKAFMDIEVYMSNAGDYIKIWSEMDYQNMVLHIQPTKKEQVIYIIIYVDRLFMNDTLLTLEKMDGRIN